MSESWERTLGWTRAELLGAAAARLHPPRRPAARSRRSWPACSRAATRVRVDVPRPRPRTARYRWVQGNARSDLDAGRIYVTAADITERKALGGGAGPPGRARGARRHHHRPAARAPTTPTCPTVIEQRARGAGSLDGRATAPTSCAAADARRRGVIEWLDPDTGQRAKDPFDTPPDGEPVVARRAAATGVSCASTTSRCSATSAPTCSRTSAGTACGRCSTCRCRRTAGCWGFVSVVSTHENVTFYDEAAPLLRLAGEAFLTALARGDDAAALAGRAPRARAPQRRARAVERGAGAVRLRRRPRPEGAARPHRDGAGGHAAARRATAGCSSTWPPRREPHAAADRGPAHLQRGRPIGHHRRGGRPRRARSRRCSPTSRRRSTQRRRRGAPRAAAHRVGPPVAARTGAAEPGGQLAQVRARRRHPAHRDLRDAATRRAPRSGWPTTASGWRPTKRNEVFGVFTRLNADDQYPGSGIGLATCAKIVAYHGGQIRHRGRDRRRRARWSSQLPPEPAADAGERPRGLELRPVAGLAAALAGAVAERPGASPGRRVGAGERRAWRRRRRGAATATSRWSPRRPARPPPARCARRSGWCSRRRRAGAGCRR